MNKKYGYLFVMLFAIITTILVGCNSKDDKKNNGNNETSGNVQYTVTVKDPAGDAYESSVIVKFIKDGVQAGMQVCDDKGVATKELPAGTYTIELGFTSQDESEFYYDKSNLTVTAEDNKLDISLSYAQDSKSEDIYPSTGDDIAYNVGAGCTYVNINAEKRNYFLFTPKEAGIYEISFMGDDNAVVGYYGSTFFIMDNSVADFVNGKIEISIIADMIGSGEGGTSVLVLGVDSKAANGNLVIKRVGDPKKTIEDEPWIEYSAAVKPEKYTLPGDATIKNFDLFSKEGYSLVYNENDGYYHLNTIDGPLVLVNLVENSQYIASYKNILDTSNVCKYFFDENGDFIKKENYANCLLEYISNADENKGVYPLTEDLKYIIQSNGDHLGWFDKDNDNYLFKEANGINPDLLWLVMCCYID